MKRFPVRGFAGLFKVRKTIAIEMAVMALTLTLGAGAHAATIERPGRALGHLQFARGDKGG